MSLPPEQHIEQQITHLKAKNDFAGLGKILQGLMRLPQSLCKVRGNCCRVATFKGTLSYDEIVSLSHSDDPDALRAQEFLTLFEPYATQDDVRAVASEFVDRVRDGLKQGDPDQVAFFKCRFVGEAGNCLIHEDRPTGCRVYPFPHSSTIYHPGCGFEHKGKENWDKIEDITQFFEKRFAELSAETETLQAHVAEQRPEAASDESSSQG